MLAGKSTREGGSALIISVFMMVILFGATASIIIVSGTNTRAVRESADQSVAFYLADGGLEAAKREIADQIDPDDDGVGTVSVDTPFGNYGVVATDLGDDLYQLASAGNVNDASITLTEVVRAAPDTQFPKGAISIIGDMDKAKVKFKKHLDLILDGGENPAIAVSDETLFDEMLDEFAKAIKKGDVLPENISGGQTTVIEVQGEEIEIALDKIDEDLSDLEDLVDLYEELLVVVDKAIPTADTVLGKVTGKGTDVFTFGSPDDPQVVHFDEHVHLHQEDSIVGYGTLIVSDDLKLHGNASLDWHGDVFVYSDEKKHPRLTVDGNFNVTGNVVVLGEGKDHVEFKIGKKGHATIDGSLFVGTNYAEKKGKKAKFKVDGTLTVNGLLTLLGSKIDVDFKKHSNLTINGMLQIGVVDHPKKKDDLKMKFDGAVSIYMDPEMVAQGASSLTDLGIDFDIPTMDMIVGYSVETQAWAQVYEGQTQSSEEYGSTESTQFDGSVHQVYE